MCPVKHIKDQSLAILCNGWFVKIHKSPKFIRSTLIVLQRQLSYKYASYKFSNFFFRVWRWLPRLQKYLLSPFSPPKSLFYGTKTGTDNTTCLKNLTWHLKRSLSTPEKVSLEPWKEPWTPKKASLDAQKRLSRLLKRPPFVASLYSMFFPLYLFFFVFSVTRFSVIPESRFFT